MADPVALVGFSSLTMYAVYELPDDVEIWSANDCHLRSLPRIDRAFDIHTEEYIRTSPGLTEEQREKHIAWLKAEHDFKIYMHEVRPEYPASEKYPLEEVLKLSSKKRLTSSFCYLIAMAILEGRSPIHIIGFDMARTQTEYIKQREAANYWIGHAEGKGIEVIAPPESQLVFDSLLYGYEAVDMISRQQLEKLLAERSEQLNGNLESMHQWQGILADRGQGGASQEEINEAFQSWQKCQIEVAKSETACELLQELIAKCDLKE